MTASKSRPRRPTNAKGSIRELDIAGVMALAKEPKLEIASTGESSPDLPAFLERLNAVHAAGLVDTDRLHPTARLHLRLAQNALDTARIQVELAMAVPVVVTGKPSRPSRSRGP